MTEQLIPDAHQGGDAHFYDAQLSGGPPQHSQERLSPVESMIERGWAKDAPDVSDQLVDTTRTERFRYIVSEYPTEGRNPRQGETAGTMTEHEGLVQLITFLDACANENLRGDKYGYGGGTENEDLSALAGDIRSRMAFIGDPEYAEAAPGLKAYWLDFLAGNPDGQVCVATAISGAKGQRKSDTYLLEKIMESFSDEEWAQYGHRIVTDPGSLTALPEDTKTILLDDWIMSGYQFGVSAQSILKEVGPAYRDSIEINLIAASPNRLQQGLAISDGSEEVVIPIRAYYRSRLLDGDSDSGDTDTSITGLHSSADFGFEFPIANMVMAKAERGEVVYMPPLTCVIRPYRYTEGKELEPAPVPDEDDWFPD